MVWRGMVGGIGGRALGVGIGRGAGGFNGRTERGVGGLWWGTRLWGVCGGGLRDLGGGRTAEGFVTDAGGDGRSAESPVVLG